MQASKVYNERMNPPEDDNVWILCPYFTFKERFSITSGQTFTEEIMHKVMLNLIYGCNGFNIDDFNKTL